jgi:hypothetical protein
MLQKVLPVLLAIGMAPAALSAQEVIHDVSVSTQQTSGSAQAVSVAGSAAIQDPFGTDDNNDYHHGIVEQYGYDYGPTDEQWLQAENVTACDAARVDATSPEMRGGVMNGGWSSDICP